MKTGIILHWTAGTYTPNSVDLSHYHGGIAVRAGFAKYEKFGSYGGLRYHCWGRNLKTIGLTVCAMLNAKERNWGRYPVTRGQITSLCLAAAEVAFLKNIPLQEIKTHAEAAIVDGYGIGSGDPSTRWDLARLEQGPVTVAIALQTGEVLRRLIGNYMREIKDGVRKIRKELHYD